MTTDVSEFISDLDGGILEQKLSIILSEVAAAVVDLNKSGQVSLNFNMKRFY